MGLNLSFTDYQTRLQGGQLAFPRCYCPYFTLDVAKYHDLRLKHKGQGNDLQRALDEFRVRTGTKHFHRVYPVQARALGYSQVAFPAYRFILPEVITDDWLATVDWHKEYHRDHLIHQPLTAYVVHRLLEDSSWLPPSVGKPLSELIVEQLLTWDSTKYLRDFLISIGVTESDIFVDQSPAVPSIRDALWAELLKEAAILAALFHDIGYPWQYINTLSQKLAHANHNSNPPSPEIDSTIKAYGNRLVFSPFNGYRQTDGITPVTWSSRVREVARAALRGTHGLPGALHFLFLNDAVRQYPDQGIHPIRQFCVEWAAVAILMHDMAGVYWGRGSSHPPSNPHLRLRSEVDPLSCLLTLADQIQDFGRPSATFHPFHTGTEALYANATKQVMIEADGASGLRITYKMDSTTLMHQKRMYLPTEQYKYFDSGHGYLDLSGWGIKNVSMIADVF